MNTIAPINAQTPIAEDAKGNPLGYISRYFRQWLLAITTQIQSFVPTHASLSLTTQAASLVTRTAYATTAAGLYRVSYYVRITRAATTSSSLTVTLGWLESAVALTQAFAAITGNTIGTVQSGSILVRADTLSALTVATAYASVGGTTMQYRIDVTVEQVS
jgi:hypothetical protein